MRSYFDLTADPRYRIQELLAEAEHERLVSQCRAREASVDARGGTRRRLGLGLIAASLLPAWGAQR